MSVKVLKSTLFVTSTRFVTMVSHRGAMGVAAWALVIAVVSIFVSIAAVAVTVILWRRTGPRVLCQAESEVIEPGSGTIRVQASRRDVLSFPGLGQLKFGEIADIAAREAQGSLDLGQLTSSPLPNLTRVRVRIDNEGRLPRSIQRVSLSLRADYYTEVLYVTKDAWPHFASLQDATVDPTKPGLTCEIFVVPLTTRRRHFRACVTVHGRKGRIVRSSWIVLPGAG